MSNVETAVTQTGMPPVSTSVEPSLARSAKKARLKSSEGEGALTVTLPTEGFVYSDTSFMKDVTEALLLPADRKRLDEIRLVKSAE